MTKFPCIHHPEIIGWVDVGTKDAPVYLCEKCYKEKRDDSNKNETMQQMRESLPRHN